jgi:hypothetical protein
LHERKIWYFIYLSHRFSRCHWQNVLVGGGLLASSPVTGSWPAGLNSESSSASLRTNRRFCEFPPPITSASRTTVWDYPGISSMGAGRMEELAMHPTVKPTALVAEPKDFSQLTQPPTTLSTSNVISLLQGRTEPFARRL